MSRDGRLAWYPGPLLSHSHLHPRPPGLPPVNWEGMAGASAELGGLEQRLYPQKERGHGHATVPSLGERLATAGMIYHVPSPLL